MLQEAAVSAAAVQGVVENNSKGCDESTIVGLSPTLDDGDENMLPLPSNDNKDGELSYDDENDSSNASVDSSATEVGVTVDNASAASVCVRNQTQVFERSVQREHESVLVGVGESQTGESHSVDRSRVVTPDKFVSNVGQTRVESPLVGNGSDGESPMDESHSVGQSQVVTLDEHVINIDQSRVGVESPFGKGVGDVINDNGSHEDIGSTVNDGDDVILSRCPSMVGRIVSFFESSVDQVLPSLDDDVDCPPGVNVDESSIQGTMESLDEREDGSLGKSPSSDGKKVDAIVFEPCVGHVDVGTQTNVQELVGVSIQADNKCVDEGHVGICSSVGEPMASDGGDGYAIHDGVELVMTNVLPGSHPNKEGDVSTPHTTDDSDGIAVVSVDGSLSINGEDMSMDDYDVSYDVSSVVPLGSIGPEECDDVSEVTASSMLDVTLEVADKSLSQSLQDVAMLDQGVNDDNKSLCVVPNDANLSGDSNKTPRDLVMTSPVVHAGFCVILALLRVCRIIGFDYIPLVRDEDCILGDGSLVLDHAVLAVGHGELVSADPYGGSRLMDHGELPCDPGSDDPGGGVLMMMRNGELPYDRGKAIPKDVPATPRFPRCQDSLAHCLWILYLLWRRVGTLFVLLLQQISSPSCVGMSFAPSLHDFNVYGEVVVPPFKFCEIFNDGFGRRFDMCVRRSSDHPNKLDSRDDDGTASNDNGNDDDDSDDTGDGEDVSSSVDHGKATPLCCDTSLCYDVVWRNKDFVASVGGEPINYRCSHVLCSVKQCLDVPFDGCWYHATMSGLIQDVGVVSVSQLVTSSQYKLNVFSPPSVYPSPDSLMASSVCSIMKESVCIVLDKVHGEIAVVPAVEGEMEIGFASPFIPCFRTFGVPLCTTECITVHDDNTQPWVSSGNFVDPLDEVCVLVSNEPPYGCADFEHDILMARLVASVIYPQHDGDDWYSSKVRRRT